MAYGTPVQITKVLLSNIVIWIAPCHSSFQTVCRKLYLEKQQTKLDLKPLYWHKVIELPVYNIIAYF